MTLRGQTWYISLELVWRVSWIASRHIPHRLSLYQTWPSQRISVEGPAPATSTRAAPGNLKLPYLVHPQPAASASPWGSRLQPPAFCHARTWSAFAGWAMELVLLL
jgi:hypothetical protein